MAKKTHTERPEERVRQNLIRFLVDQCGIHRQRIVLEHPVLLNGQPQRADVVVYGDTGEPLLLAECKAPRIPIAQSTLDQAVRYNAILRARYLMLTNGDKHFCYEFTDGRYTPLREFPFMARENAPR